ncbi:MAG: hydrogenase maturation nickel metallochaperone HypA [Candidatus Coatesbacteria bacterium]
MHEFAMVQDLVDGVLRGLAERGVVRGPVAAVRVRIGALEFHSREALVLAFSALSGGTILDGARLDLEVVPAMLWCEGCGRITEFGDGVDGHDPLPSAACPGCGTVGALTGGRGVERMEVDLASGTSGA